MFKRFFILIVFLIAVALSFHLKNPNPRDFLSLEYANKINVDTLSYIVEVLAADSLEGRATGTEGELKAAYFLSMLHIENDVMPFGKDYFQEYEVVTPETPDVTIATDRASYIVGQDFLSLFPHDSTGFSDDHIIYVGYGIEDNSWNDYAYRDVKGKIVLAKEGEPKDMFGVNILTATERKSEWSADPIHAYILKRKAAAENGAKAFLYYAPKSFKIFKEIYNNIYKRNNPASTIQKDTLYDFIINQKIMQDLTGYESLDSVYYTGRRDRKWDVPVTIQYGSKNISVYSQNILAYIEGKEKADELILVIANYDHLGKRHNKIFHGANNNATGSAAIIELARVFQLAANDGYHMARSLLFVHFSAREKDHLGAKFFFKRLPFPKERIKAVIDIDMIGYLDTISNEPSVTYMANSLDDKKFFKKLKSVNKAGTKLDVRFLTHHSLFSNEKTASDGIIFYKENIPVLTFHNTLLYPFNRTPEDTPDKITWDIYHHRVKYIFLTTWLLAND